MIHRHPGSARRRATEFEPPAIFRKSKEQRKSAKCCERENMLSWLTDEHGGGWGLVASPVFKTGVTRPSRAGGFDSHTLPPTTALSVLAVLFAIALPAPARAQGPDSISRDQVPKRSASPAASARATPNRFQVSHCRAGGEGSSGVSRTLSPRAALVRGCSFRPRAIPALPSQSGRSLRRDRARRDRDGNQVEG